MEQLHQQTQRLARFILLWHEMIGSNQISRTDPTFVSHYAARLAYLKSLDLAVDDSQRQVAKEQLQGAFEHFYSQVISAELWNEHMQGSGLEFSRPDHLSHVAHILLNLLDQSVPQGEGEEANALPAGWEVEALPLRATVVQIPFQPGEQLRSTLRRYFGSLGEFESKGIGGSELMVSMNEDANAYQSPRPGGVTTVFSPASFHFALASGDGTLVSEVMKGHVTIEEVVLGYGPQTPYDSQEEA